MLKRLRCWIGVHNPPTNTAFTCMGAVFIGGPCTCCADGVPRERKFIGNTWEFGGSVQETEDLVSYKVSASGLLEALHERGLFYLGDFPA